MEKSSRKIRSRARWVLPVLIPVLLWGLAHSSIFLTGSARFLARDVFEEGTELVVGRVSGSLFGSLTVHDIRLSTASDSTVVEVDSVSVRFSPFRLVNLHLGEIGISGVRLSISRRSDGSFVIPELAQRKNESARFQIDSLFVKDLTASIIQGDSTLVEILDGELLTGMIRMGEDILVEIDTFRTELFYPRTGSRGHLGLRSKLASESVSNLSIVFGTENSHAVIEASALLETGLSSLQANGSGKVRLSDIEPFLPGLSPREVITFDLATSTESDSTSFIATVSSLGSGHISIEGTITLKGDSTRLRLLTRVAGLNPGSVHADLEWISNLEATIQSDLAGTSLDHLSGRFEVSIESAQVEMIVIERSSVTGNLDRGNLAVEALLNSSAGSAEMAVSWTPESGFTFNGQVFAFDLAAISDGLPRSLINLAWHSRALAGENGLTEVRLGIDVLPSSVGLCLIESGTVSAHATSSAASLSASIDLCASSPFSGTLAISDPLGDWRARASASVSGMRLDRVLALDSLIAFDAVLEGSISSSNELDARLELSELKLSWARLDSVVSTISGSLDEWSLHSRLRHDEGAASVTVSIRDGGGILFERGYFNDFDVFSVFPGQKRHESNLNGSFGGLLMFEERGLSGEMSVLLRKSTLNRQTLDTGLISIALGRDSGRAHIELSAQDGLIVEGEAIFDPAWDSLRIEGSFAHLDPFALVAQTGEAALSGQFSADMTGGTYRATLSLNDSSFINGLRVKHLHATGAGSGASLSGEMNLGFERGHVRATFGLSNEHLFGTLVIHRVDIAALTGLESHSELSSSAVLNVDYSDGEWSEIRVGVDSLSGTIEHLRLASGSGTLIVNGSGITANSLRVKGSFGSVLVNGFLPGNSPTSDPDLSFNLAFNNEIADLSWLRDSGLNFSQINVRGRFEGSTGRIRVASTFEMDGASWEGTRANRIRGRVLAELGADYRVSEAEITADLDLLDAGIVRAESVTVSGKFDGYELISEAIIRFDETRQVGATVSFYPYDEPMEIHIQRVSADMDGDSWSLKGQPIFDAESLRLSSPLVLSSADQRIVVVSSASDSSVRNLITFQNLKIDPFTDLMGFSDVGGVFGGTLSASTTGNITSFRGAFEGNIEAYSKSAGALTLQFDHDAESTRLSAHLRNGDGKSIRLIGSIPDADSDLPVQLHLHASDYPIAWIRSFVDPDLIDNLGGTISGDLNISGTAQSPEFRGTLRFRDGLVGVRELGRRRGLLISSIHSVFVFEGDRVRVDSLEAYSGDGWIRGDGSIDIQNLRLGEYDIALRASEFKAIDTAEYFAVISGRMSIGGTTERPRLGGSVVVNRGDFWLSNETRADTFEPITLSENDLRTLQRRFGIRIAAADTVTFDAYDVLTIADLTLRMERDTWIRSRSNPKMDIQLMGDLDVRKNAREDAQVFGSISVLPDRSHLTQFGKRFELDRGELTFNGPVDDPEMTLEASYTVPSRISDKEEVIIRLRASGNPDHLDVSFESDPTMELADIISYIATGRPASESLQISGLQSENYLQSAAGLAMGPVADLIENLASTGFGLDVIEINHTGFQGLTLTAGKYVSPRLYVSVTQSLSRSSGIDEGGVLSENPTQVAMEFEFVRQLLLSLLNRGTILRINLKWQHAF